MDCAFILIAPQMGENIGMSARAMANFAPQGSLRLVAPRDGWPNALALAAAAGAPTMEDVHLFDTTTEALADRQFVLATTARVRRLAQPALNPQSAAQALVEQARQGRTLAVLFGGERSGLSTEDIARADAVVHYPSCAEFASLNVSHAVAIMAYALTMASGGTDDPTPPQPNPSQPHHNPAVRAEVHRFLEHLDHHLMVRGFYRSPEMQPTVKRNLRVLLQRAQPSHSELQTLYGLCHTLTTFTPPSPDS